MDTRTFQFFHPWVTGSPSDLLIMVSRSGCGETEAVGLVSHDEDESEPSLEPGPPGV